MGNAHSSELQKHKLSTASPSSFISSARLSGPVLSDMQSNLEPAHHSGHSLEHLSILPPEHQTSAPSYGQQQNNLRTAEAQPYAQPASPLFVFQRVQQQTSDETRKQNTPSPKNTTGLPDTLKSGIESLSGFSLDDVRVHYQSSKPAQVEALAYTQGTNIHVGPGQEQHLAHEAWHVVQQKQGRVKPTMQLRGMMINNDSTLEQEADSARTNIERAEQDQIAAQMKIGRPEAPSVSQNSLLKKALPSVPIVQRTTYTYDGKSWQVESSSNADTDKFPRPDKMAFTTKLVAGMKYDQNTGELLNTGKLIQEEEQKENSDIKTVEDLKSLPGKILNAVTNLENYSFTLDTNHYSFVWNGSGNILLHANGKQVPYDIVLTRILGLNSVQSNPQAFSTLILKYTNDIISAPAPVQELLILTFCIEYYRHKNIPDDFLKYLGTLKSSAAEQLTFSDVKKACPWMITMDLYRQKLGLVKEVQSGITRRKKKGKGKRKPILKRLRNEPEPIEQALQHIKTFSKQLKKLAELHDFKHESVNKEVRTAHVKKIISKNLRRIRKWHAKVKVSPPEKNAINNYFLNVVGEVNGLLKEGATGIKIRTQGVGEKYSIKTPYEAESVEESEGSEQAMEEPIEDIDEVEPEIGEPVEEIDEVEPEVDEM